MGNARFACTLALVALLPIFSCKDAAAVSSGGTPTAPTQLPYKTIPLPRNTSDGGTVLTFKVVDIGTGPSTILMLHGFPDSAQVWRNQVPVLVRAGYRVIAPDLRGFGSSDKPQGVADYDFFELFADVIYILSVLQAPTDLSAIVAHDYGTALGTFLTALNGQYIDPATGVSIPYRTDSYVMMSTGHLNLTAKFANINDNRVRQRQLSWYALYFQAAGVAEAGVSANNFEWYRTVFAPDTPKFIVDEQVANLAKPVGNNSLGSLTAAFNWYRNPSTGVTPYSFNVPQPAPPGQQIPDIQVPVLGVWGCNDAYITKEWMQASARFVARNKYTLKVVKSGHWVQLEAPYTLNNLLLNFIPKAKKS